MSKSNKSRNGRQRPAWISRGAGAGLLMSVATAALAVTVLLPPGATVTVPATTAATQPALDGVVINDTMVPFTIADASGAVVCSGKLQDRVVRSNLTGRLDFYYAIRETEGPGAVYALATTSFGEMPIQVGYRTDGLGTVPPRLADRTPGPGDAVTFRLTDPPVFCAKHQESRFMLIMTGVTGFKPGGQTRLTATTGASVVVPTVEP